MEDRKEDQEQLTSASPAINSRDEEAPPVYEAPTPEPSSSSAPAPGPQSRGPTVANPFNFPASEDLPPYSAGVSQGSSSSSSSNNNNNSNTTNNTNLLAIPQLRPDPASPFLPAFSPSLLSHGIIPATWAPFIDTLSAFLTASVSDKAVAHAGDVARHLGSAPRSFGQGIARNAREASQHVRDSARRRDVLGVAGGVVGGVLTLTVGTALRAVGTVVSLPGAALQAVTKRPLSPRERADAYATVASRDWLHGRGLHARVVDTRQLCGLLGVGDVRQLLEAVEEGEDGKGASALLGRLEQYIGALQVRGDEKLELGVGTLWLVVNKLPQ